MNRVNNLLFNDLFDGKPLFSSQMEIVRDLITLNGSPYFKSPSDLEKHQKEFVRLKTYISQLLSSSVSRSVTEDFKDGLLLSVKRRIKDERLAEKLVNTVIADLKQKNSTTVKSEQRATPLDQFFPKPLDDQRPL